MITLIIGTLTYLLVNILLLDYLAENHQTFAMHFQFT